MNEHNDTGGAERAHHAAHGRHHGKRRWILAVVIAAAAGAMAYAGANEGEGMHGMHGHGMHGPMDPAAMDKHINRMVERILAGGTSEQKAKVAAIAKAALTD